MDVAVLHRFLDILGKQTLVHERLGRFGSELHHHSCRGIRIHVGVLPCHIRRLGLDDLLEDFTGLGRPGKIPLVAVCNVFLCDFLPRTVHQFHFHTVLDVLYTHALLVGLGNPCGNFGGENNVLSCLRDIHRLRDGIDDLLLVELNDPTVALDYIPYHGSVSVRDGSVCHTFGIGSGFSCCFLIVSRLVSQPEDKGIIIYPFTAGNESKVINNYEKYLLNH